MTGSIAGVGNYVNGYGESIKRSMSSDGPVSSAQKKTPVKPNSAVPKSTAVQKSVPSAGGAQKALPSTAGAQKSVSTARPNASVMQKSTNTTAASKATQNARTAGTKPPTTVGKGPQAGGAATKPPATTTLSKAGSNTNSVGKTRISPESRPKPGGANVAGARSSVVKSAGKSVGTASDPLGIEGKAGDSKSKSR